MEKQPGRSSQPSNGVDVVPDPEVSALPRRRRFSARYKLDILKQVEAAKETGEVGVLLRKEGLYSSHLTDWRRERDMGALQALEKKRGPKPTHNPFAAQVQQLQRDNALLQQRLTQAEAIIDVQKKISTLLGLPCSSPPPGGRNS